VVKGLVSDLQQPGMERHAVEAILVALSRIIEDGRNLPGPLIKDLRTVLSALTQGFAPEDVRQKAKALLDLLHGLPAG
jgi:predicted RNase H-like HicB family nuclease